MKEEQSPLTGDSFDMIDVDWRCKKTNRLIIASARPWELDKAPIPQWCPL